MGLIGLMLAVCLSILLAGCGQNDESLSPERAPGSRVSDSVQNALNKQRASLGLRVIDTNWFLYRSRSTQDDWKIHKDGFGAKSVFKGSDGNVTSEEDYYYSDAQFDDRLGHGWECITFHYDYGKKDVILSYTGTNETTKAILSKYLMFPNGPSTNLSAVMAAVKKAAVGWPDAP
jgi:hypothetical protein